MCVVRHGCDGTEQGGGWACRVPRATWSAVWSLTRQGAQCEGVRSSPGRRAQQRLGRVGGRGSVRSGLRFSFLTSRRDRIGERCPPFAPFGWRWERTVPVTAFWVCAVGDVTVALLMGSCVCLGRL